ncbi:hypothetical protein evm_015569, partial [Chilo suppressalis]
MFRKKVQYPQSKCSRLSLVRDLPPVAGSIIWAKQIDHQLTAYLKRVEDVLGKGWENHIDGQKLKADGDSFRLKLDTQEVFDDWARKKYGPCQHIKIAHYNIITKCWKKCLKKFRGIDDLRGRV